jgi:hypothetical protein
MHAARSACHPFLQVHKKAFRKIVNGIQHHGLQLFNRIIAGGGYANLCFTKLWRCRLPTNAVEGMTVSEMEDMRVSCLCAEAVLTEWLDVGVDTLTGPSLTI